MATERIPLTQPIESRTGSFAKDSYSSNCFFETRDTKREFIKRPGIVALAQVVSVTPPAIKQGQGLVSFNNELVSVVDNEVYTIDPNTFAVTHVGSTTVRDNQSYFVKTFLDSYLIFHNQEKVYLLNQANNLVGLTTGTIVKISVSNPGSGYSTGVTLTVAAPPSGTTATAQAIWSAGTIAGVNILTQGSGYTPGSTPTVTAVPAATKTPTGTGLDTEYTIVVSNPTGIYQNMQVSGTNIGSSATVVSVVGSTVTLSVANTGAVSGTITFTDGGSGATFVSTVNSLPSDTFVSGLVFLDNYAFLGTDSNRIYNCNLGDPVTWDPLNYISFEQTQDSLVGITRHLNYLVAFGHVSTQFFYDAGNAVGSPLAVASSYTSEIGCANGDSIVATSNTVAWIGTSKTSGRGVYVMDGVSPIRVSTHNIDKHLEADDLSEVSAYCYAVNGHTMYVLTLHGSSKTLVLDITEKIWYTWTQYAMASEDQPNPGTYYESYFRPTFYTELNGKPYVLDDDTAVIYTFDQSVYQDNGQPIYCRTVTDLVDNGTTKRKFYGRLEIVGDKVDGVMQVRHTGDDYNTWSSYRTIDLSAPRSQIYLGGADRRRAWEFLVTSNCPLRLDAAEIDYRIGEMDQEQSVGGGRYRR